VVPDVYVEKVGDEYRIVMNEEGIPRVRINKYYKEYLRSHKKDEATRFIRDKLNSAVWFMNSLQQRRRTIFKVTEAIIRLQKDFLDHGVEHLKPLYLKDVAQEIGMHESTVCRVTANKYVHTPQGLFEMKYFFNNGVGTADGTDMASTAVKSRIAKLLQDEGNGRKLSDREVVAMLARDGIKIARRTVAKYRGQLGIMSSSKRRKRL
jgi:RNA polymerase sigma-54 factor